MRAAPNPPRRARDPGLVFAITFAVALLGTRLPVEAQFACWFTGDFERTTSALQIGPSVAATSEARLRIVSRANVFDGTPIEFKAPPVVTTPPGGVGVIERNDFRNFEFTFAGTRHELDARYPKGEYQVAFLDPEHPCAVTVPARLEEFSAGPVEAVAFLNERWQSRFLVIPAENPVLRWTPRSASGVDGDAEEKTRIELRNLNGNLIAERSFEIATGSDVLKAGASYNFGVAHALDLSGLVEEGRNYDLTLVFSRTTKLSENAAIIDSTVEHRLGAALRVVGEANAAKPPRVSIDHDRARGEVVLRWFSNPSLAYIVTEVDRDPESGAVFGEHAVSAVLQQPSPSLLEHRIALTGPGGAQGIFRVRAIAR